MIFSKSGGEFGGRQGIFSPSFFVVLCVSCVCGECSKFFLTKFFGRGYMNNVVGCHVILVPCAQILETKCSNQPSGKRCLTMSQVMSCEYHVKNVGLIGLVL